MAPHLLHRNRVWFALFRLAVSADWGSNSQTPWRTCVGRASLHALRSSTKRFCLFSRIRGQFALNFELLECKDLSRFGGLLPWQSRQCLTAMPNNFGPILGGAARGTHPQGHA